MTPERTTEIAPTPAIHGASATSPSGATGIARREASCAPSGAEPAVARTTADTGASSKNDASHTETGPAASRTRPGAASTRKTHGFSHGSIDDAAFARSA